jgi:hypothetical protein
MLEQSGLSAVRRADCPVRQQPYTEVNHMRANFASALVLVAGLLIPAIAFAEGGTVAYQGKDGPGKGKHIVFIAGDEEYRSEESFPMLARLLSQRHGFKCTVVFSVDPDGTIDPDASKSLSDATPLDSADAIVILTRWRNWPDEQMKHFVDAYQRGVPIIGLRTATHAFKIDHGAYRDFSKFGKRVLGEDWVNHWGDHKKEATRAIVEPGAKDDPILRGVGDIFVTTDVYEAYPPPDAKILFRGQVLSGMTPDSPPSTRHKKRATDKQDQGVNDPMMPIAWTRLYKNEAGKENRIFCTTMGAATDLEDENLRRLVVNAIYWGLGMDVPAKADVQIVGEYHPSGFGFKGYKKGVKPQDLQAKEQ